MSTISTTLKTVASIRAQNASISLPHRRAVVVGGTSGIGEGVALRLAQANVSVTIVGRSKERGDEIVNKMRQLGGENHEFVACDCFQMKNIRTTCDTLKEKYNNHIDYLVLTQGMATIQGRTETSEGIDQKLALHFFGRMLFVRELLPALRHTTPQENGSDISLPSTGGGKVLSVLSAGVHKPFPQAREDFELRSNYSIPNAADAAGFYNDLSLDALARQGENSAVTFIHAAPGFVATRWGTEMPWLIRVAVRGLQVFGRSQSDCGEVMCDPLFHAHADTPRVVLVNQDGNPAARTAAHDDALSDWVWARTNEVLDKALAK